VRILFHPFTLAVYAVCLALLVRVSGVLRTHDWGKLMLLTASLSAAVIILAEWTTRPYFEEKATEILKSNSLSNIQSYFGKDQVFVATLGDDEVIGVCALEIEKSTAIVVHWHVKSQYRNRGLGWDILEMVIDKAKTSKKNAIQRIQCETYNLQTRAEKSLKDHGFQPSGEQFKEFGVVGLFGVCRRTWVKTL